MTWRVETLNDTVDVELDALPADMRARLPRISDTIPASGHRLNPGRIPPPRGSFRRVRSTRCAAKRCWEATLLKPSLQLGYLRLQCTQIGSVGERSNPTSYPRHKLAPARSVHNSHLAAQRLHILGETIQPAINTVMPVALLDHFTA